MKNTQTQTNRIVTQMIGQVINNPCIKDAIDNIAKEERKKLETEKTLCTKEFNVQVTGWTYDHLFIKVTDSDGYMTGCDSWRSFEELTKELRNKAIASGFRDIKVNMMFA